MERRHQLRRRLAFIFADLIILPILNIYRKYYGTAMTLTLLGTFYAAMATAGYIVELIFGEQISSQPAQCDGDATGISWNYTSWLNIAFLALAAVWWCGSSPGGLADAAHDGRLPRYRTTTATTATSGCVRASRHHVGACG